METQTVQAIFEGGKLVPLTALDLREGEIVELTFRRQGLGDSVSRPPANDPPSRPSDQRSSPK
jgi:hypothetical protein